VDERFLKRGEDLLFGEMAVALNMEKAKVGAYIGTRIGEMQTQQKEA
jgi:hypothetical protein